MLTVQRSDMNITMIGSLPPTKGISHYILGLVRGLAGHVEIDFIGFKKIYPNFLYPGGIFDRSQTEPKIAGVKIRNILTYYNPLSWFWAGLTVKGDLVHAQWWSYVLAPAYLAVLAVTKYIRKKKVILTIHNTKPHERGLVKKILNTSVLSLGDYYIVHTDQMKNDLLRQLNKKADKISVIPLGIEPVRTNWMDRIASRRNLGIQEAAVVILFFGAIRPYKGLDVLLQALAILRRERRRDFFLVIAGQLWGSWQPYQVVIDQHDLSPHVKKYLSFIPDDKVGELFSACDVVALPYREFNAQTDIASLAISAGKPMVTSRVGGLPDIAPGNSFVSNTGDPQDLARTITGIFNDPGMADKVADKYRDFYQKYSWETAAKKTEKLYREIWSDRTN